MRGDCIGEAGTSKIKQQCEGHSSTSWHLRNTVVRICKKCRTAPLCGVACSAGGSWRRDGVRVASGAKLAEPSDSFKNNQMHDLFPILSKRDFLSDPAMRGVEFHNL